MSHPDLAPALTASIAIVKERDRYKAERDELLEALASLAELYAMPGESNVDRFERVAELFHRETGCVAPGKDIAAASGDSMSGVERLTRWENWYANRAEKARAALAKVGP